MSKTQSKTKPVVTEQQVQKPYFTINGKQYTEDMLTQEQLVFLSHLIDLEQQINRVNFQLQQLQVCKQAFAAQLEVSMKQTEVALPKDTEVN